MADRVPNIHAHYLRCLCAAVVGTAALAGCGSSTTPHLTASASARLRGDVAHIRSAVTRGDSATAHDLTGVLQHDLSSLVASHQLSQADGEVLLIDARRLAATLLTDATTTSTPTTTTSATTTSATTISATTTSATVTTTVTTPTSSPPTAPAQPGPPKPHPTPQSQHTPKGPGAGQAKHGGNPGNGHGNGKPGNGNGND